MKPKISIVIPIYNVEKYLDECLESVVGQTYKNLEIILVNDGSTDSCGMKCDEWSKKDERIRVFHKSNGGLMNAWKYGVIRAQGNYIGFVDPDDWIDLNMYETLLDGVVENDVDLVFSGILYEKGDKTEKETFILSSSKYESEDIEKDIFPIYFSSKQSSDRSVPPSRVTKLFKKDVLLKILEYCDEEVSIGEDLLTTFATMSQVRSIFILSDFYPYHYRIHGESMIRAYSDSKYEKIYKLKKAMEKVANELYDYDFSRQLDKDYVALMLEQMELEILFSGKSNSELKKSLRSRREGPLLAAINNVKYSGFSKKQKLYLFLIKHNLISLMIFIRKLKKVK